eukprot:883204-Amorphochlora_amoeboformis.AAC.1
MHMFYLHTSVSIYYFPPGLETSIHALSYCNTYKENIFPDLTSCGPGSRERGDWRRRGRAVVGCVEWWVEGEPVLGVDGGGWVLGEEWRARRIASISRE